MRPMLLMELHFASTMFLQKQMSMITSTLGTLGETIEEMQKRIDVNMSDHNTSIRVVTDHLKDVQAVQRQSDDAADKRGDELEAIVTKMSAAHGSVQEDVRSLREDVRSLREDVRSLRGDLRFSEAKSANSIIVVQDDVRSLRTEFKGLGAKMEELIGVVHHAIGKTSTARREPSPSSPTHATEVSGVTWTDEGSYQLQSMSTVTSASTASAAPGSRLLMTTEDSDAAAGGANPNQQRVCRTSDQ